MQQLLVVKRNSEVSDCSGKERKALRQRFGGPDTLNSECAIASELVRMTICSWPADSDLEVLRQSSCG